MWFDSWSDLGRILVVTPLAYSALVAVLRISGARTLSKLNAFDLVVTVALGSTLATVLLSSDVSLSEGVLALVLLVALQIRGQLVVAPLDVGGAHREERAGPAVPLGFLPGPMRRARVTEDEVRQAARATGKASLDDVAAVVLETDGTLSVLPAVPDLDAE